MKKLLKLGAALLLVAYAGMCTLAKFDGGAANRMPSQSADAAERSGMLVQRLTVIVDSGGPAGIGDGWIEIAAVTDYRFGALPYRRAAPNFAGDTTYLLCVISRGSSSLGGNDPRATGKARLRTDGWLVEGFDIVPPLPDTIIIRARPAGEHRYPLVFADGRSVWDAAPRR